MNAIDHFLAVLRGAGAAVRHEGTRVIVDRAEALDDPEFEGLASMSKPASTPEREWIEGTPVDVIVLTGKGPAHRLGGQAKEKK